MVEHINDKVFTFTVFCCSVYFSFVCVLYLFAEDTKMKYLPSLYSVAVKYFFCKCFVSFFTCILDMLSEQNKITIIITIITTSVEEPMPNGKNLHNAEQLKNRPSTESLMKCLQRNGFIRSSLKSLFRAYRKMISVTLCFST